MPKTTNPRHTEFRLYRLAPVEAKRELDAWEASTIKEPCYVWAKDAHEARAMTEVETRTRQSEAKTRLPFFSPWSSSSFAICEEVAPHSEAGRYPAGLVFTARGPVAEASPSSAGRAL